MSLLLKCKDKLRWADKYLILKGIKLDLLIRRYIFPYVLFSSIQIMAIAAISNIYYGPEFREEWDDLPVRGQHLISTAFLLLCLLYPVYLFLSYWFGLQAWNLIQEDDNRKAQIQPRSAQQETEQNLNQNDLEFRSRATKILSAATGKHDKVVDDEQAIQVIDEAQVNMAQMDKLAVYSSQRGVMVSSFHVKRLVGGLLYLSTLVTVQILLAFVYVALHTQPSLQFMIASLGLTMLLIVLGLTDPFADKWNRRLELANCSIHLVTICFMTGCTAWGDASISLRSRRFISICLLGLIGLFVFLNFLTIVILAVKHTRLVWIRFKIERHYSKLEKAKNEQRQLINKAQQIDQL